MTEFYSYTILINMRGKKLSKHETHNFGDRIMAIDTIGLEPNRPYQVSLGDKGLRNDEWEGLEADPKLVEIIKKRGFSNPLPVLKADGMNYTVLEGAEILKASKEAGLKEVWVFIVTEDYTEEEEAGTEVKEAEVVEAKPTLKTGDFVRLAKNGNLCKVAEIRGEEILVYKTTKDGFSEKASKVKIKELDI